MVELLMAATADNPPDPFTVYLEIFIVPVLVALIVGIMGSGGLWVYMQKRAERKAKQDRDNDPQIQLLLGLAYDRILYRGEKYISRGYITPAEFEGFKKHVYDPYKALGGNGLGAKIYEEVEALPLEMSMVAEDPRIMKVHIVDTEEEKKEKD